MVFGKIAGRDRFAIRLALPLGLCFDIRAHEVCAEVCAAHHLDRKDLVVVQPISQHQLFLRFGHTYVCVCVTLCIQEFKKRRGTEHSLGSTD